MGSVIRLLTVVGFVVWTLLSLGAYGMVSLFGGLFARNADAIAGGNPEATVWLSWLFGLIQSAGAGAVFFVWLIGALGAFVIYRLAGRAPPVGYGHLPRRQP